MENLKVLIETSARHVHVTKEDMAVLFGEGTSLTFKRALTQPEQFLSDERVTLEGAKRTLANVAILGPERSKTQVEISLTDARSIGVNAPVRESGNVEGSGAVKLVGPNGTLEIKEGVIAAKRHVHVTPEDAEKYFLTNGQIVKVKVETPNGRNLIFDDVVIRVSPKFATYMHVDTDEANAAGISGDVYGEVIA